MLVLIHLTNIQINVCSGKCWKELFSKVQIRIKLKRVLLHVLNYLLIFLSRLRSIAAHRDHFVWHLSSSHSFLVVIHSYVLQVTHAFLRIMPQCFCTKQIKYGELTFMPLWMFFWYYWCFTVLVRPWEGHLEAAPLTRLPSGIPSQVLHSGPWSLRWVHKVRNTLLSCRKFSNV